MMIAGTKVLILGECKCYARKIEVGDILEFAARLDDIAAHKGIMFSTIGFQEGAIKVAKSRRIALVLACNLESDLTILESATAAIERKYKFRNDTANILSWLCDSHPIAKLGRHERKAISRLDIASRCGLEPQPFGPIDSLKVEFGLAARGFVIESEVGQIALDASGLITILAMGLQRELTASSHVIEARGPVTKWQILLAIVVLATLLAIFLRMKL